MFSTRETPGVSPSASADADTIRQSLTLCIAELASESPAVRDPLVKQMRHLDRAWKTRAPKAAFLSRRLYDSLTYVEDATGHPLGEATRSLRALLDEALRLRQMEGAAIPAERRTSHAERIRATLTESA